MTVLIPTRESIVGPMSWCLVVSWELLRDKRGSKELVVWSVHNLGYNARVTRTVRASMHKVLSRVARFASSKTVSPYECSQERMQFSHT